MIAFRSAFQRVLARAPQRTGRRWPLALRVLLYVLAGLELVYLVGANLFLNCNILPLAFASTNQVKATIRGGWSVIPGRVHVRNARVTFQDHNVQFSIDMRRGFLVLQLRELAQRSFHVLQLRGEGVAFRMRNRIDPWDKNEPWVGALASIPEFAAPAVYEAYVPEPPIPDAQYNLWKLRFDDVDVGVSEVWAQQFRYRGAGRARGNFQLKPARELWVGPATLDLNPGLLSAGTYRIAPGIHGHIECTVHRFDVRPVHGLDPLRYISAHIRLDSPALDPQVYALFGADPATKVSSASGSLHLDVETQHGVFTPQSRLDIEQHGLQLRTVQGDLEAARIELHASSPVEIGSQAELIVDLGTLKEPIAPGYPPQIQRASATVVSDNRDTSKDFHLKEARLNEARLNLPDARWLNRWLQSSGFAISAGGAALLARGHYAAGELNGDAVLETNGIGARLSGKQLRYAGAVALHLLHVDPDHATGSAVADITGRSLRAELGQGELNLAGIQVHVLARRDATGNQVHGEAHLSSFSSTGNGVDIRAPQLTLLADSEQGTDGTQLTHFLAQIPALIAEGRGARLTSAATARGTFAQPKNKTEQRLEVSATLLHPLATFSGATVKQAAAPRVDVQANLRQVAGGALSGTLALLPAAWHVDSGNMRFSGKSALKMDLDALDWGRHSGSVGARLTSTGVTVGDTKQNAACPWSRVQAVQVDAQAHLLADHDTAISVNGEFGQTEMSWGEFTTRADIGVVANFDQGLLARDGGGKVDVSFRNASLQSGTGAQGWAARMATLDIEAQLAQRSGKLSGTAKVNIEGARGRIGETKVSTDMNAQFVLDDLDLVGRTAHASGAVHVRNASLPQVADPVSKWWADVQLDSLYGHAAENLELGGTFRANLRDATPGLAVLSEQGSLPKWVASAFPLRDLSVTGSLARRCRLTDIHLVQLSGGPAVARGRLQSVPNGFQGALLMRVAGFEAVSAGLDFDAKHTHVGLFDGDAWLARWSQSFDRQSDDAVKLVCPPEPNQCAEEAAGVTASTVE